MRAGLFITGTDTGVGKTLVGAVIARALARRGIDVGVFKPLQSGGRRKGGKIVATDMSILAAASGAKDPHWEISPYKFEEELAPIAIIERDGVSVSMDRIVGAYMLLREKHDFMLVEGVGGLAVPLFGEQMTKDLVRMLDLPVLIVARAGLGTVNHTLLTNGYALRHGLRVAGVVLNNTKSRKDGSEAANPGLIERFGNARILGRLPYARGAGGAGGVPMRTLDALARHRDMDAIIESAGGRA